MKVLISHPTGNAFFRAAAMGLYHAGMLGEMWTTVATFPDNIFDKLSTVGSLAEFGRRRYDPALQNFANSSPWFELGRFAASKLGLDLLVKHETGIFSVDGVYTNLDKKIAKALSTKKDIDAVYAYEDGALYSFCEAKKRSIDCFYDLPIGYWRASNRLLEAEQDRWPEWAATLIGLEDSTEKRARKDEELHLADKIFVASQFTKNTLDDYPAQLAPIQVVPYAFPPVITSRSYIKQDKKQPLKLLFVGGLSQRKGIADLFAAAERFKQHVVLTIVGKKTVDNCAALNNALAKHNWIPSLPHNQVLKLMQEHDVLVFPSLFEGFGLVITEAMSQGTPVITTDRTAGPDLIIDGENGWLIKAGSTEALEQAIEHLIENREEIAVVGKAAMETAKKRTWDNYGQELVAAIL